MTTKNKNSGNNSKHIEQLSRTKKIIVFAGAVLGAFLLWIYAIGYDSTLFESTYNGIPVTVEGEAKLAEQKGFTLAEGQNFSSITVVAKGTPTIVVGKGKAYVIPAGNPGLSRGGSGDVLTGIIAAFAAQGLEPVDAAAAGVFVHGAAADLAAEKLSEMGMLPSDVIENLPFVFKKWNR
jgi:hypothetical protein